MKFAFVIIISCLIISCLTDNQDPCSKTGHRRIPNEGLRYVNYKISATDNPSHDSRLLESWYYVGSVEMPESPPRSIRSCGTKFPIWLAGSHSHNSDVVERTACLKTLTSNCSKQYEIKIKLCPENFFLYYLRPTTDITEAYCFGTGVNDNGTDFVPQQLTARYDLHEYRIDDEPISRVRFICNFDRSTDDTLWYKVFWHRNGETWFSSTYAKESDNEDLYLTEETFVAKGFSMGENISCSVRAFANRDGLPGELSSLSNELFVGIKILTPFLSFTDNETDESKRKIKIQPTVPIGCEGDTSCKIWLTAYTPKVFKGGIFKCSGIVLEKTACGIEIYSSDNNSVLEIPITVEDNGQYRLSDDTYSVFLQTDDTSENLIWKNYTLPPISVNIRTTLSTATYPKKICYAHTDPHLITFDGRKFDNHYEGVFIMYRHNIFDSEIQIIHTPCNTEYRTFIKCPCGVAVRIGRDRFVINVCNGGFDLQYKECLDNVLTIERISDYVYKIIFPYGTYAVANIKSNRQYINVDIYPSIHDDKGGSMGLCGILNGDCTDDFHDENGKSIIAEAGPCDETLGHYNQPQRFISAWQVKKGKGNLFNESYINNGNVWEQSVCSCEQSDYESSPSGYIPCHNNSVATCTRGHIVGKHSCDSPTRRRRSVQNRPIIPSVLTPEIKFREKRSEPRNWTEAEAQIFCETYMAQSSVFSMCDKIYNSQTIDSIETCVMDIMITNDTEWSSTAMENMRVSCSMELERNISFWESSGEEKSLAELIEEQSCPNNCSDIGVCTNGKCHCEKGYGSSDCSLDLSVGPVISGLLDFGLCDERQLDCDHAYIFGHVFTDENNLTCRLEEFSIYLNGSRIVKDTHYSTGEFETLIEVVCPVHETRYKRSSIEISEHNEFVFGYKISVSNDGNNFQPGHDLFVYNSECQLATDISGNWHFTLKRGYCFIDNACVQDGVRTGNCSICDSKTYQTSWTTDASIPGCEDHAIGNPTENDKDNYLFIIGIVAGVITGVVVAVIVMVKVTGKRAKKRVGDSAIFQQPQLNEKVE